MNRQVHIRLYTEGSHRYEESRDTYGPDEFGGQIPLVGDLIADPGVPAGLDRTMAQNRTVFEVVKRYFQPARSNEGSAFIALLVRKRPGNEEEADILGP